MESTKYRNIALTAIVILLAVLVLQNYLTSCSSKPVDREDPSPQPSTTTPPPPAPTDGLIAYYPFNGNAKDSARRNSEGQVYGATLTADRFGRLESAYEFDGRSHFIEIGSPLVPEVGDFTVSVWEQLTRDATELEIIAQTGRVQGRDHFYLGKDWQSNRIRAGDQWQQVNYDFPLDRQWHHFVLRKTNTNAELFLDGQKIATSLQGYLNPSGNIFYVGKQYPPHREYFPGRIDDIRVYNRALPDSAIDSLFHEGGWAR
jgi:hypothetical protein